MEHDEVKRGRGDRTWSPRFWVGASTATFGRVIARNRCAIHPSLAPIAITDGLASVVNSTLGGLESLRFGGRLRDGPPATAPLFILGHWRSGTTLLHELLALDPRLAAPTMYQCLAPHHFLLTGGWLPRALAPLFPARRPMDDMGIDSSSPWEDEFALCLLGARSPYETFAFPNRRPMAPDQFDPETFPIDERARWIAAIERFTRKVRFAAPGRRLVLKSPPHTARIRTLLAVFPDARFVHLVRNPFEVFPSTVYTWRQLSRAHGWQRPHHRGLEETVLTIFRFLDQAWERDRQLIPEGRVHQLRYEDLVAAPTTAVATLYRALDLGDPDATEPAVRRYFASREGFRRNRFRLTPETAGLVAERWAAAIDRYGYRELAT